MIFTSLFGKPLRYENRGIVNYPQAGVYIGVYSVNYGHHLHTLSIELIATSTKIIPRRNYSNCRKHGFMLTITASVLCTLDIGASVPRRKMG